MRDTIEGARLQLAAKGIHLTPADMQALWWYPEKDLYEHMGGEPAESNRVSYIDAFRAAALARGITNEEIERAILSSAGRGSGRNSGNDTGADPQGRGGDRPVIPASKREAIGTVGAAPTARSALSGERFSLASKDFQRYFGDRLPGGRLYGREDLALGGILRNPGTPSVALSSPVEGYSGHGLSPLISAAQARATVRGMGVPPASYLAGMFREMPRATAASVRLRLMSWRHLAKSAGLTPESPVCSVSSANLHLLVVFLG